MNVELLVAEAEGDPFVGVVEHLGAQHVAVERDGALPVTDGDRDVVQPHLSLHRVSLLHAILRSAVDAGGREF